MSIIDVINTIKNTNNLSSNDSIELELKALIDYRLKTPYFCKKYINGFDRHIPFDYMLGLKTHIINIINISKQHGIPNITQTINFIKTYNNHMFVKQLCYTNSIQDKDKKNYYIKKSISNPIYLNSKILPDLKLSANIETITDKDINEYDLVRFRHRYTINFEKDYIQHWKLDITFIKECNTTDIKILQKIRDNIFVKNITPDNFIDNISWDYADRIEVELEYISDINMFDINQIKEVDKLFESRIYNTQNSISSNSISYIDCITLIARLLYPHLEYKFKNGSFGVKQLGSNPIELNKLVYNSIFTKDVGGISEFIITEKIDGIRSMLIIHPQINTCYVLNNKNKMGLYKIYLDQNPKDNTNLIILDSEYYNEKYYVFDIIYICKNNTPIHVYKLPFLKRKEYMDIIINTYNRSLYHKNYVRLTSNYGNEICNFYKEMTCITEYKIDGLIFISVGNSYIKTTQYKWKPVSTIDFIAKKCIPELLGIHPYISKECKTLYLLFSGISSYDYEKIGLKKIKHYNKIFNTNNLSDKYFPIQFSPSSSPNAYLFWSDLDNLDGKVVELTYTNEWQFIKIRNDRELDVARKTYYGNYFKIAELIWMKYTNPLSLDILCSNTINKQSYFHEYDTGSESIRKYNNYVKLCLIRTHSKNVNIETVIDLGAGRGQDLYKYIETGFKNILLIENDSDALSEIIHRKYKYIEMNNKNLGKYNTNLISNKCSIFVNKTDLLNNYKTILNDIISNNYPINNKSSFITCNFALHYLIYNKTKLTNFCRILDKLLEPGGIFIFTAFNGKKINDLFVHNSKEWNKYINDKLLYSIKKKYDDVEFTGIKQKIDVLLPFSNNNYYTEYLININLLNLELSKRKIDLIVDDSFDTYLDKYKNEQLYKYKSMTEIDKEYISLYHYYIYNKRVK